jgi:hypothetical protein
MRILCGKCGKPVERDAAVSVHVIGSGGAEEDWLDAECYEALVTEPPDDFTPRKWEPWDDYFKDQETT